MYLWEMTMAWCGAIPLVLMETFINKTPFQEIFKAINNRIRDESKIKSIWSVVCFLYVSMWWWKENIFTDCIASCFFFCNVCQPINAQSKQKYKPVDNFYAMVSNIRTRVVRRKPKNAGFWLVQKLKSFFYFL